MPLVIAGAPLVIAGATACSGAGSPNARLGAAVGAPALTISLATSAQTTAGTWATVPMGRLDEPLNTFWQLFYRPRGTLSWSDHVEATATATNGGLVLAAGGGSVLVGVRPSVNLKFTPLILTSNGGRSWSDGLVTDQLEARPGALAMSGAGALALVGRGPASSVLTTNGRISTWRALVSRGALAGYPAGRNCSLGALTSVAYEGAQPLVGGSCAHAGVVGLFGRVGGEWRLVGPDLPPRLHRSRSEVLALQGAGPGVSALIALVQGARTQVLAATLRPGHGWTVSPVLPLGPDEQVASVGPTGTGRFFVLLKGSSGVDRLMVVRPGAGPWRALPSPPAGTATAAFNAGSPTDALVAEGTTFSVWSLAPGSDRWAKGQVVHVPVQFGSSS